MVSNPSSEGYIFPEHRRPNKTTGPYPLDNVDIRTIKRDAIVKCLDTAPKIWNNGGVNVVRIAQGAIVKYGYDVNIYEANNMRLVLEHTTIRLPALLDSWVECKNRGHIVDEETTICYIVMEYIDGMLLDEAWPGLSDTIRRDVQQQMYDYLQQLHNLESDRPGPIGGGVSNGALFTDYGAGPFTLTGEMENYFNDRLAVCQDFGIVGETQPCFDGVFKRLVMCHMDLHLRNIILDHQGKVWLIDWDFAGMYPVYFEIASLLRYGREVYFQYLLDELDYKKFSEETSRLLCIGFAYTTGAFCKPRNRLPNN